jgi:hypothetical protein
MRIYIDIDNTICTTNGEDYTDVKPNFSNIEKVNILYEKHTITMWTARGSLSGKNWFLLTENQLNEWGVKYHELRMGKPAFDLLIDDKTLNSIHHWNNLNLKNIFGIE